MTDDPKPPEGARCCANVSVPSGTYRPVYRACGKTAKVTRDGKRYCGTHDPERRERRQAERDAAWRAEREAAARDEWRRASRVALAETALRWHRGEATDAELHAACEAVPDAP